ncbi:MAG: response regulator [Deltaproteobacteria bacterium]|nr:response regulator [Deltaproteobacteria bacterium]
MKEMKIMLVDDEVPFVETMTKRLTKRKLNIISAFSGNEALERLQEPGDVDVVILDVKMPDMDGIETLREIKRNYPLVEVIMLTGHATVESAIGGLKSGAFDYVMKPCDIDDLINKVSEAFEKRKQSEGKICLAQARRSYLKSPRETAVHQIDLRELIPETIDMVLRNATVGGITTKKEISDSIPLIQGDISELQQVMVNLLDNAIDAVISKHGSSGGELKVEVKLAGERVRIAVADNGCGISPENMEKIFAPFFSTKPVGKGTGLGLSVCFGIIEKMGGLIDVTSEKDKGTTFTIRLPAST